MAISHLHLNLQISLSYISCSQQQVWSSNTLTATILGKARATNVSVNPRFCILFWNKLISFGKLAEPKNYGQGHDYIHIPYYNASTLV